MGEQSKPRKKVPERRCIGCGERKEKRALVRVVRLPDTGGVELDMTGKKAGRGAYLCPDAGCLKKAVKARRLQTNLECEIPPEIVTALEEAIRQNGKNG